MGDNVVFGWVVGCDCWLWLSVCYDVEEESRKYIFKGS